MPKLTRKAALQAIRSAGIENDQQRFLRLYVENRISRQVAMEEFREGRRIAAHFAARDAAAANA